MKRLKHQVQIICEWNKINKNSFQVNIQPLLNTIIPSLT